MPNLTSLSLLSCNGYEEINLLVSVEKIRFLSLSGTRIKQPLFESICFQLSTSLEELDISSCELLSIRPVARCTKLRSLRMQTMGQLPEDSLQHLTRLSYLEQLDLGQQYLVPILKNVVFSMVPLRNASFRNTLSSLTWYHQKAAGTPLYYSSMPIHNGWGLKDDDLKAIACCNKYSTSYFSFSLVWRILRGVFPSVSSIYMSQSLLPLRTCEFSSRLFAIARLSSPTIILAPVALPQIIYASLQSVSQNRVHSVAP